MSRTTDSPEQSCLTANHCVGMLSIYLTPPTLRPLIGRAADGGLPVHRRARLPQLYRSVIDSPPAEIKINRCIIGH